jgi:hypothetical protein
LERAATYASPEDFRARQEGQVLKIAYANASGGVGRGGFFPEGANRTIRQT